MSHNETHRLEVFVHCSTIIERIFAYLPAKDLKCCAQTCKLWHHIAKTAERKRTPVIDTFFKEYKFEHFKSWIDDPECNKECQTLEPSMREKIALLRTVPYLNMLFLTEDLYRHFDHFFTPNNEVASSSQRKSSYMDSYMERIYLENVVDRVCQGLPKHRILRSVIIAEGVIGSNLEAGKYLSSEAEGGFSLSALFLPRMEGVEVAEFPIDKRLKDWTHLTKDRPPIKALLIFDKGTNGYTSKWILHIREIASSDCVVAGSRVGACDIPSGCVVAFYGDNVSAAKVTLVDRDKEAEARSRLESLRGMTQEKKCIAFVFSDCCFSDVFIDIFNDLYPNIPLVGVGGDETVIEYRGLREFGPIPLYTIFVMLSFKL